MSLFSRQRPEAAPLPHEGRLPGFDGATGWLNSSPLSVDDLRGKVVLVDFWTYTCINWLRTLAYVRAWSEKYADGLVVVGVHTPEFPFERDVDNVRWAAQEMAVTYPIALDSSYAVWDAFSNSYWPAVSSPPQKGAFVTTSTARAGTRSASESSNGCSATPAPTRRMISLPSTS